MFDSWSDSEVLAIVEDSHCQAARVMARKLAAIAELLERRIEEELAVEADVKSMITGFRRTTSEVSAAMNMTPARARTLVGQAEALHTRLPAVGALLAAGEVDFDTVEVAISRTDLVDEDLIARDDASVAEQLGRWQRWSRVQLVNAIDQAVNLVDAEAVKKRRVAAYDDRGVTVSTDLDGMAVVRVKIGATEGAATDAQLSVMAKAVCAADPRSLKNRRADAFVAMRNGATLTCQCPNSECPKRAGAPTDPVDPTDPGETGEGGQSLSADSPAPGDPGVASASSAPTSETVAPAAVPPAFRPGPQVVINVIAAADTVNGASDAPGYLCGFGVIDAALVLELAREATRRLVEEPIVSADQALCYRHSAALARFIRARDLTCRFPGCTVPAQRCDIDHTEPFNHDDPTAGGHTVPENLACYCREHHRLKTFDDGWHDRQLEDGTIVWTSPVGETYVTTPAGADLFGGLARPRRPEDRRRVAAARRRLNAHRHISTANRYRNQAAREEIRVRCWRNDFRRWREFFHGAPTTVKPSKSPYARFVNDRIEPEELEPNWQPPPLELSDPDEPPPF